MNLSDLVHRTAGDNKVLTTTSRNTNLFQQTPSTANDTLEQLFSMPNTQWMNTSLFFTGNPDPTTFTNPQHQQAPPQPPQPQPPQPQPPQQIPLPQQPQQTKQHKQENTLQQNTPKSIQPYPSSVHSEATTIKKPVMLKPVVTGENVSKDNIEDGYIQFVLTHDPNYISDGIESLMYAKRKFSSVPKTGDLSYTTWDIYSLVLKLHKRDIKNWSQLVGQLGLADMAGRPQFAQRVKRWMHRYKIDCYFDYLLGNKYYFNAPNEKYSGCLMMGNYKKRRPNIEPESQSEEEEFVSDEHRLPILLAGSRKRMRDHSQNSLQLYERKPREDSTDPEDISENQVDFEEEEELQESDIELVTHHHQQHEEDNDVDDDDDDEEEEDELASTSSSPGSPVIITRVLNPVSPKTSLPTPPSCSNCSQYENTILSMKLETNRLKAYIATLENTVEQHNSVTARMNKLLRLKDRTERWRKQLIEDLARGPSLISEDEEEEEEEEEEETTDGDT